MLAFVVQRVTSLLLILWGISIFAFFISRLIPADPAQIAAGLQAGPAEVEHLREIMGLNKPLIEQYVIYMSNLLHGDLGMSFRTGRPVSEDLRQLLPATIELAVVAMSLATLTGIPMGIVAAGSRGHFLDLGLRLIAIAGVALPVFWLALVFQVIFYRNLGLFPASGRIAPNISPPTTITGFYLIDSVITGDLPAFRSSLHYIALPAITLAIGRWATTVRMVRVSQLEIMSQDYVRTARAKGLRERTVIWGHAFRNTLIPVVTWLGLQTAWLLTGTVLIESIFSWPGLGNYAVQSIQTLDFNPIVAVAMFTGIIFVTVNFLVDILYGFLDPRIRTGIA